MSGKRSAKAEFRITSWDENAYAEFEDARKLTRTVTTQDYVGDLAGEGRTTMLMAYGAADVPVHYCGIEQITGALAGKAGSFVVQAQGTFADGVADTSWFVVPGSGTGELAGLRGEGTAKAAQGASAVPVTLEYHFEA
jgi:hypothetical protein